MISVRLHFVAILDNFNIPSRKFQNLDSLFDSLHPGYHTRKRRRYPLAPFARVNQLIALRMSAEKQPHLFSDT
jgi:hypothetical protein